MGKGPGSKGPIFLGPSQHQDGEAASQPPATVTTGGRGLHSLDMVSPTVYLCPSTLAGDPGPCPSRCEQVLQQVVGPFPGQEASGWEAGAAWAGNCRRGGGVWNVHEGSGWQPVQDMHCVWKALIGCPQTKGPTLPSMSASPPDTGHSPPPPPLLLVPAIPGFALAFSQTLECACWLHGGCSWNRGDKAQPVFETWADGVQAAPSLA